MPLRFFKTLMLIGLAAVAILPIIHLLTRKRFDVVDWGASSSSRSPTAPGARSFSKNCCDA